MIDNIKLGFKLYEIKSKLTAAGLWQYMESLFERQKDIEKNTCVNQREGSLADYARGAYFAYDSLPGVIDDLIKEALESEQADKIKEDQND